MKSKHYQEDTLVVSFSPRTKTGDLSCMVVCRQQSDAKVIANEILGDDAEYVYKFLLYGEE